MRFYLFRRSSRGFIQEIVFNQILDTRLNWPPDMIGVQDFYETIICVYTAKASCLICFLILFDYKTKGFSCFC